MAKELKAGDMITCRGLYGSIGTTRSFYEDMLETCRKYGWKEEIIAGKYLEEKARKVAWCHQTSGVLCSDRGYYELRDAERAAAIPLLDGEEVIIEGTRLRVKWMGNYANMIEFVELV